MITKISSPLYDQLIADFEVRSIISSSSETDELHELREQAFEQFKKTGFPTTKVEDWKYTNLAPFLKQEFVTEQEDETLHIKDEVIAGAKIKSFDCYNIVLVNGQYRAEFSDIISDENVYVSGIASAMNKPAFKTHFGKYTNIEKNHLAALNTGLFNDGLYIEIISKAIVDKPLHIIHVVSADSNIFIQPRFLFVAGAHAEATIVESFVSTETKADIFVNNVSEIEVGENAHLHHYYIQTGSAHTRYVHHTEVHQNTSSVYNNYKASFPGSALLRNNLNIALDGENIESHLYGIYLAGGKQVVDNHTIVDHRKPHCQSNELYKGVMKDEAIAVFNGKIFVQKQAQKTNAFQQNNNLMLSKKAVVDSKPQLEIFADDVKCSHGSTVGQFNKEALFYLKSRGIGDEKARALLIHAFAYDVTEKIPHAAVKSHINRLLEEGLK
ncbi:MAG: Fe-S cluster assembly protein SufD [Panacibacter sp.]